MSKRNSRINKNRKQLHTLLGAYKLRLERLYDSYVSKLLGIFPDNAEELLESDPLFSFDRFPEYTQQLSGIVADYARDNLLCFEAGITDGVALAYSHTNAALNEYSVLSNAAINTARKTAANKFISARLNSPKGLSLSHLVWNYAEQAKSEFEMSVSNVIADGLQKGTSAAELGRQVRQYLNNPDMMYRRYHRTVVDANGNKQDVVKWRKRVIDSEGKVRFVEQPLEQVGQGQYRSARKNSERLMRTEINSAYLRSNNERWAQEPFVIGQVISVSPQHPCEDMCDYLAGEYPKDFLFFGWHPQCMCTSDPITISGDEQKQYYKRLLNGEDMSGYVSPNAITDVPNGYKNYIAENHDKIVDAGSRGKLAWHLEENTKYWKDQFSDNELALMGIPTEQSIVSEEEPALFSLKEQRRQEFEQYRDNPDYLDVQYDPETNGLMATHREHNTHPNDNQRSFGYMAEFSHLPESERGLTGDQLEKECQKELYRMGHKAILRQEGMRGSDGNELAALDMDLNNVTMDIFTPRGEKWANGIWDKSKQIGRVFEQTEVSSNSLCVFFYDASMYSNEKMLSEIAGYKEKVQRTRNAAQNIEKIYCVVRGASSIITYDI